MFNFNTWRHKTLIYLNSLTSPNLSISHHFCTKTSDSTSFAVSYLIHNFGFSPQFSSKLCSTYNVRFKTNQKPDSVLNFFKNHGFSNTQLREIIAKAPLLLCCNPSKRVLPKFEFFRSKGASSSDIVNLVTKSPMILSPSLENHIIPTYELAYRFLQSHKDTLALAIHSPSFFQEVHVASNIKLLIQNGVVDSNMAILLRNRRPTFQRNDMLKLVEELKDLGFNPSKTDFAVGLLAKTSVTKTRWKEKVDVFKKWGWSEEDVLEAFRKQPYCMLTSIDKINSVMNFWVNQLGWDTMIIAKKRPNILLCSLEKRIIPRAAVLQYLLNNNLRNKNASLTSPFIVPEKLFVDRFIKRFKTECSYLLKLYEEKLNLAYTTGKT